MKYALNIQLENIKNVHFIGVGGIGMSGIAALMLGMGYKISGSDAKESEITLALKRLGAVIDIGHKKEILPDIDVVVISSAIKEDNPELCAAVKQNIPVIHRAFMLSKLAGLKKTVTIAGTHGKTTTTSMTAVALEAAGARATAVVGGILKSVGSNIKMGGGEYFVAEADESDGSFLDFKPLVTCVTNIDADHLDHYGDMTNLKAAFIRHIESVPFYGAAVLCVDDPNIRQIIPYLKAPLITCSINQDSNWTAKNISFGSWGTVYTAYFKGKKKGKVSLQCCGEHNVRNSLLALAAGSYLGFSFEKLVEGLAKFTGVKRRIDRLGIAGGVEFVDDYGHHPTEIKATLAAVRQLFPKKRIVVLFQPHRYSRTKNLYKEFGKSFADADKIYVAPIYAAGEKEIPGVSSDLIIKEIQKNNKNVFAFNSSLETMKDLKFDDVFLTLGAGDVWKFGEEIKIKIDSLSSKLEF